MEEPCGVAGHMKPARQRAFAATAAVHAGLHGGPHAQQGGACLEGQGQRRCVGREFVAAGGFLTDGKASADAVVGLAQKLGPGAVKGGKLKAGRVRRERLGTVKAQALLFHKWHCVPPGGVNSGFPADALQSGGDGVHVHRPGEFAFKPEEHGGVGAVAFSGVREGAVEMSLNGGAV